MSYIGNYTFSGCISLISIAIPKSVTWIGQYAFSNCTSLDVVYFEENSQLSSIGKGVFGWCSLLRDVTIESCVTSIDYQAFYLCTSLQYINFKGTVEQWNTIEKGSDWNDNTDIYTIYCTDGEITKEGTITYYEK